MLLNPRRQIQNEPDTRLTARVIDRLRVRAVHDCKIRCTKEESLPQAPTTERLRKPPRLLVFLRADDGSRARDLRLGKPTLSAEISLLIKLSPRQMEPRWNLDLIRLLPG